MAAILTWIAESAVGQMLLKWLVQYLADHFKAAVADYEKRKEIEDAAKNSVQPLKDATTAKEVDDAADSALNGI